jgi:hypothetical protein
MPRRCTVCAHPKVEAIDMLLYRDALDRVSKIRDSRELTDTLTRARVTGDAALAEAILFRWYALENPTLVGAYFERYPDELSAWEEFMASAQKHNTLENLSISGALGVSEAERPEELGTEKPQGRTWRPFAYRSSGESPSGAP